MLTKQRALLGQLIVEKGLITHDQLEAALTEQATVKEPLGHILHRLGFLEDLDVILPSVSEQTGIELANLRDREIPDNVISCIPAKFATFYKIIPITHDGRVLTLAAANPRDIDMFDALGIIYQGPVRIVLASEREIAETIRRSYGVGADTIASMLGNTITSSDEVSRIEDLNELDDDASIGRFINQILLEAYKDRATDIHIEPYQDQLHIRYRIDGVLRDAQIPANIWHFRDSISSRIKIMSNLNIAERRLPQDGRFKAKVVDADLDLRVSFMPTQFGESIVIRILSSTKLYNMSDLGLEDCDLTVLGQLLRRTHGIIFVTGPTGSGKTTTLYSCLAQLNKTERKIITIEDPIEYQLSGTTQVQVNPGIGLTFASGLRSMLRHDPDVMMVGEVRDLETAQIAVQIALTGHLVFSTLHTNDAASGITRLVDMGVEPYLVASAVSCFIAQRLVRVLCPKCKKPGKLSKETLADFSQTTAKNLKVFDSVGCPACNFTGYRGRQAIYEFFLIDDESRHLIMSRASASVIKEAAVKAGMRTMLADGWSKVKSGVTSAEEVLRVIRQEG